MGKYRKCIAKEWRSDSLAQVPLVDSFSALALWGPLQQKKTSGGHPLKYMEQHSP